MNITVGMDMRDKNHSVCVVDGAGEVQGRGLVTNTREAIKKYFKDFGLQDCTGSRNALGVG
jgi:hypothetical protein